MKLRKPFVFGLIFGIAFTFQPALAGEQPSGPLPMSTVQSLWADMADQERTLVDLVAAEFFEQELSLQQRLNIAAVTSQSYRRMDEQGKAALRAQRRDYWAGLTASEKEQLSFTAAPAYRHLTEAQKMPFRQFALQKLDLKNRQALADTRSPI